jgi:hypothetical protein
MKKTRVNRIRYMYLITWGCLGSGRAWTGSTDYRKCHIHLGGFFTFKQSKHICNCIILLCISFGSLPSQEAAPI